MKDVILNKKGIVLVIDDDITLQKLLRKRLEASGYEYHYALTVEGGIVLLDRIKPDLVLLDIMFDGDAYDASDFLRMVGKRILARKGAPPIIIISSLHNKEVIDYMLDNGASAYIGKPYDPAILLSMIRKYVFENKSRR
jgi:DNA-binding response OmpR family regulator